MIPQFAFGLLYLLIELFYIGIPVVRVDGCLGYLEFLTCGAPLCRSSSIRWVLCYVGLWDSDGLFGGFKSF